MIVYLDLVFLLNLFFDFILLLTVNNTLKRNASLKRILSGSLFGSLSIFTLFIPMTTEILFVFKIMLSFFMCIITFGWKEKRYFIQNVSYFYMTSTILGGFLYYLNLTFSENQNGLMFTYENFKIPYMFLIIFSPCMLYIYMKQRREQKMYQQYYPLQITFLNGKKITVQSFLDTGNHLKDPITKKYVILLKENMLKGITLPPIYYVSYHSLNHHGIIKCFKIDFIELEGRKSKNYLIGISEGNLLRDGVDCVLNSYCLEELL